MEVRVFGGTNPSRLVSASL